MIWLLPLMILPAFADVDVSAIKDLNEELPSYTDFESSDEATEIRRLPRKFEPPIKKVPLAEIKKSGTALGAIRTGTILRSVDSDEKYQVPEMIYLKYFNLEDEHNYKYLLDKSGRVKWRVPSRFIEPIKEELVLFVPPHRYTPAPDNIVRAHYDRNLRIDPAVSFYTGIVNGHFMRDLYEDTEANEGFSTQYAVSAFTTWEFPIRVGGALHFEKTTYFLHNGGRVIYTSPSVGPMVKTRDFEIVAQPLRLMAQFRASPFARATALTGNNEFTFKFNSYDVLAALERPIQNRFGEFVLGFFFQSQWLNIKDQESYIEVEASNLTNNSFGVSFSQVFE